MRRLPNEQDYSSECEAQQAQWHQKKANTIPVIQKKLHCFFSISLLFKYYLDIYIHLLLLLLILKAIDIIIRPVITCVHRIIFFFLRFFFFFVSLANQQLNVLNRNI